MAAGVSLPAAPAPPHPHCIDRGQQHVNKPAGPGQQPAQLQPVSHDSPPARRRGALLVFQSALLRRHGKKLARKNSSGMPYIAAPCARKPHRSPSSGPREPPWLGRGSAVGSLAVLLRFGAQRGRSSLLLIRAGAAKIWLDPVARLPGLGHALPAVVIGAAANAAAADGWRHVILLRPPAFFSGLRQSARRRHCSLQEPCQLLCAL